MAKAASGRLVVLSGPSCAGKSPLFRALERLHPDLVGGLQPLVLYTSREPRPGERDGVDYHFRDRVFIEGLRTEGDRHVVLDVRGDAQALDLRELEGTLRKGDVLFEGNPFVGEVLLEHPRLKGIPRLAMFLSPLSREEILDLRERAGAGLPAVVADVMRRKLLRRTRRQKGELSLRDLETVEKRAGSAFAELRLAWKFRHVIPNHDGEDSENWDSFYWPLGDARRAVRAVAALLRGERSEDVERWEADLLPS
jgi:guanylate kinase